MEKFNIIQSGKKKIISAVLLAVSMLLISASCYGSETYTALNIYPKNVGVFTVDGKQQFVAFGVTASGVTNITRDVDWESSDENLVTIDENGLATIVGGITMGNVKISCTYPKKGKSQAGPNHLLLRN